MRHVLIAILVISLSSPVFSKSVEKKTLSYWSETMNFGTPAQKLDVLKQMRRTDNKIILDILIKALENETDEAVRKQIIQILYEKKEPRALKPLLKNLKTATNPDNIATTLAALGQLQDKRSVSSITNFLNHEKSEVIQAAVRALGKIKDSSVAPRLLIMLTNIKTDKEVIYPLINTLGEIRYKPAFPAIRKIAINTAKPEFMRAFAITALGKLGDTRALDDFFNLIKKEKKVRLRIRVIGALGEMKTPKALKYFKMTMSDGDKSIRYAAVKAAGKLKSKKMTAILMYKLKYDKEPKIMVAAAEALFSIGDKRVIPIVIKKFTASRSTAILESLLKLIDKSKNPKAIPALRAKQKEMKKSAIKDKIEAVLTKWGKTETKKNIKKNTKDKNKKNDTKTIKKNGRIYLR